MRRVTCGPVTPALDVWNGYGSRDLLEEHRGRPPVWSSNPRGWVAQPANRADLIALAELRGFDVRVEKGEAVR